MLRSVFFQGLGQLGEVICPAGNEFLVIQSFVNYCLYHSIYQGYISANPWSQPQVSEKCQLCFSRLDQQQSGSLEFDSPFDGVSYGWGRDSGGSADNHDYLSL